jgi:hypothetical protein
MLSISHAATGAFIASKLPHPALYIPLAIAAHFFEDWIPHWDMGTGLTNGTRTRRDAFLLGVIDLFVALAIVYWLWQADQSSLQTNIWIGAFSGLLPDFIEAPRTFLNIRFPFLQKIHDFHATFHHSIPNKLLGLLPQIAVLGVIIWLTVFAR